MPDAYVLIPLGLVLVTTGLLAIALALLPDEIPPDVEGAPPCPRGSAHLAPPPADSEHGAEWNI